RLLHLVKELPGISGERFDVFSLPFRIDRVEGEGRLSRTAQPGDDHQFVARNFQREILQIMLTRAANFDEIFPHARKFLDETIFNDSKKEAARQAKSILASDSVRATASRVLRCRINAAYQLRNVAFMRQRGILSCAAGLPRFR